jgi:hypothetical protein
MTYMAGSKIEIILREVWKRLKLRFSEKRTRRKLYWLLLHVAALLIILALMVYRPGSYNPIEVPRDREVSTYLTHELLPQLHNGAQLGQPFDLTVSEEGINDAVARSSWPKYSEGISLSAPQVLFVPGSIVLMGTATIKGVEFVVTIALAPQLDEEGLLNLRVAKVKVGAMNITLLARITAKKMYQRQVEMMPIDKDNLQAKIVASLLNDERFEPVLNVNELIMGADNDGLVRLEKIAIKEKKLILHLVPVPE